MRMWANSEIYIKLFDLFQLSRKSRIYNLLYFWKISCLFKVTWAHLAHSTTGSNCQHCALLTSKQSEIFFHIFLPSQNIWTLVLHGVLTSLSLESGTIRWASFYYKLEWSEFTAPAQMALFLLFFFYPHLFL